MKKPFVIPASEALTTELFADQGNISAHSANGQAPARVIETIAVQGFPFVLPRGKEARKLVAALGWPRRAEGVR